MQIIEKICEVVGCGNIARGNIGSMNDRSWTAWVCEDCYRNKVRMRPLGYDVEQDEDYPIPFPGWKFETKESYAN